MVCILKLECELTLMAQVPYMLRCSKREGLQGVDFDWEIPRSEKDQHAYATLLIEASASLNKADLLISVALHPRQFMPQRVYDEIDR
jgi:hypothetical protein